MKPLFVSGPSFQRLIFFIVTSLALMVIDHRFQYLQTVRASLSTVVYPLQYVINLPVKTGQWLSSHFSDRIELIEKNNHLHEENLLLQVKLQRLEDVKNENRRLRKLLEASKKRNERVVMAEVLAIDLDPFTRKILINKGTQHGVFEKQPLLDAEGVLGQVLHVSPYSSTVILITDPNHALPVQIARTGLRTIAVGMGTANRLALLYLPNDAGILVGDIIVTSGLGGQFPQGYPVGTVVEVNPDIAQPYAQVQAIPAARLERNREVLLVLADNPSFATTIDQFNQKQ